MNRTPRDPATEVPIDGLGEFTGEFKLSRIQELATLYSFLDESDFQSIGRICHTWKGFAVPYGFGELAHLASELEESCEQKDTHHCRELLNEIETYLSSK